ncbi:TonB-dependent receptor [Neiella litorisoli]|uniref:TonB-dependent receptor n=1 Tax=Neiella litorisoli TaxID=2771431 RepID=UPI001CD06C9E|nr:TonB-dependent receptor [Neiella litorisoli]
MKHTMFTKTKLAASLSLVLGAAALIPAQAADEIPADDTEVIQVTGIRSSQAKAMDLKRTSAGVVDAISAEDIGKFPDTNLAESLQRITGVSIDRVNGEGSKVTVRGFGPDFNLVLFNGRTMPTSGTASESTRSFDFANIASESVSEVAVSKTGRADLPSGGIGATIDIRTARPFDNDGMVATVTGKVHHDTSVDDSVDGSGDDYTPEVSGIFSNTFMDDTIGIGVSASYKKRDSTITKAGIDGWRQFNTEDSAFATWLENKTASGELVDDNQNPHGNYFYARNMGFSSTDVERERYNAQVVFQYAPMDNLVITTDYTYSKLEDESYVDSFGLWFQGYNSVDTAHVDENGTFDVVTEFGGDYSGTMSMEASENENKSLGLNIDWQVNDDLALSFDAHDSSAESNGALSNGTNRTFFIKGGFNFDTKTYDASSTEIPTLDAVFTNPVPGTDVNLLPEHYNSLFAGMVAAKNETDLTQYQFDGSYFIDIPGIVDTIEFGMAYTDMETRAWGSYDQQSAGWYDPANLGIWEEDMELVLLGKDFLGDFSGGGKDIRIPYYYTYNQKTSMAKAEDLFGVQYVAAPWQDDHKVQEETTSAYIQLSVETELMEMPLNVLLGGRYEKTDVTASSLQTVAEELQWISGQEWFTQKSEEQTYTRETSDYSEFLPNLDINLEIVDDLIARVSLSKTITRPTLGQMKATNSLTNQPKPGSRTGFSGNPGLEPFSSDNIDLSLEYYYDEASYVSAGWFNKDVENFLQTTISEVQYDGLRDPYVGPRAELARSQLAADGVPATDENVFQWLIDNGYGEQVGDNTVIRQSDDDPVVTWLVNRPNNVEDLRTHGWEIAWQHWFWDTGFGFQANATFVSGDTEYDVETTTEQFALPGLSDSANFSVFYDKDGLQARAAYNWRDDFLSGTGQAEAGGPAPQFTESYGQLDVSVSYEVNDQLSIFFEGLNVLEEEQRIHGRYKEQMLSATQGSARYAIGASYKF